MRCKACLSALTFHSPAPFTYSRKTSTSTGKFQHFFCLCHYFIITNNYSRTEKKKMASGVNRIVAILKYSNTDHIYLVHKWASWDAYSSNPPSCYTGGGAELCCSPLPSHTFRYPPSKSRLCIKHTPFGSQPNVELAHGRNA